MVFSIVTLLDSRDSCRNCRRIVHSTLTHTSALRFRKMILPSFQIHPHSPFGPHLLTCWMFLSGHVNYRGSFMIAISIFIYIFQAFETNTYPNRMHVITQLHFNQSIEILRAMCPPRGANTAANPSTNVSTHWIRKRSQMHIRTSEHVNWYTEL